MPESEQETWKGTSQKEAESFFLPRGIIFLPPKGMSDDAAKMQALSSYYILPHIKNFFQQAQGTLEITFIVEQQHTRKFHQGWANAITLFL